MMTPFGSAVAPDVKMISATSSRVRETAGGLPSSHPISWRSQTGAPAVSARARHVLADQHEFCRDDEADTREKIGRRTIVDRDDDDAAEQAAPECGDPLGAVLAEEHDLVAFANPRLVETRGKASGGTAHIRVAEGAAPESVVIDEKLAAGRDEFLEDVDERVARHA